MATLTVANGTSEKHRIWTKVRNSSLECVRFIAAFTCGGAALFRRVLPKVRNSAAL
jgi:hypothetical protein